MAGKKKRRCCRGLNGEIIFKPAGLSEGFIETVELSLDEFEAVRLCDYDEKNQIEAGEIMKISRGTVQRLLNSGRKKIMDCLLHEKKLLIKNSQEYLEELTSNLINRLKELKETMKDLKIAFPTNDGKIVEEHFGHCEKFVFITIKDGKIFQEEILEAPEHVPGAYPQFLKDQKANVVITGGMGQRAIDMLKAGGIEVLLGGQGEISNLLDIYLEGNLKSTGSACTHHHHDHEDGHKCKH
ncbi:MAG: DUF134 domain-containing protein [Cetobacterium sp.]|uniref:DUF134 domain-containing protein n=1 Tax=Cetobacterium sp. TaxID=2071632 RepID=UPI003F3CA4A4